MMGVQGHSHANVRDILAPLFCNGRSFSGLIDELSRHFKFEALGPGGDAGGGIEASSESQSTDSEAEGDMSDETNDHLIQVRVTAQARRQRAHASDKSTAEPTLPTASPDIPRSQPPTDLASAPDAGKSANSRIHTSTRRARNGRKATPTPSRRKTRSRSKRQQQQQWKRSCSPMSSPGTMTAEPSPASTPPKRGGERGTPSGRGLSRHETSTEDDVGSDAASNGYRAGRSDSQTVEVKGNDLHSRPCEDVTGTTVMTATAAEREGTGAAANCSAGGTAGVFDTKGTISSDALTVLSVTANGNGWSEVVAAALAARARAGCVFALEVDADSPQNSDAVRQVFWDEESRTPKALEVRTRLIPPSQKVLLCSAWVDSGEYLEAAARLVALCHAEVYGIACVRFEQNPSTQGLVDRFNLFAKSMPKGSVPKLNTGVKKSSRAATKPAKGFHKIYRGSGLPWASTTTVRGSDDSGCGEKDGRGEAEANGSSPGSAVSPSPPGRGTAAETRKDRANKRKRGRGAAAAGLGTERDEDAGARCPPVSTEDSANPAPGPDPMDEDKGGMPSVAAADEVSAGEELAQPGDGGEPAQRFGGGGDSEGTCSRDKRQTKLYPGALVADEEGDGDYAADSERSTDYDSIHVCGGGGRESDDHDLSEKEHVQHGRGGSGKFAVDGRGIAGSSRRGRRGRGRNSSRTTSHPDGSCVESRSSEVRTREDGRAGEGASRTKRLRIGKGEVDGTIGESGGRDTRSTGGKYALGEADCGEVGDAGIGAIEEEGEKVERNQSEALHSNGFGLTLGTGATPEWKAKLDRQPIFMSRGRTEKVPGLPSHGTDDRARGVRADEVLSRAEDPEDDRDRASSCSSVDSIAPNATRGVRKGTGGVAKGAVEKRGHPVCGGGHGGVPTALREDAPPNSPGGVAPRHNTTVYEANDPTEDRHAELAHESLGVRIYCVCDGHGGSRAAQFVCDNLAADVLARVVAMAPTMPKQGGIGGGESGCPESGDGHGRSDWVGEDEEVKRALLDVFSSCDERFIAQLDPKKNRGYINAGCCVVLALMIRSKLYVAHVGDCRVVLGTSDAARFPPNFLRPPPSSASTAPKNSVVTVAGDAKAQVKSGNGIVQESSAGNESLEIAAVALSRDHNCDDVDEAALVKARSGDDNAIRVSKNDEKKGVRAIKRVAGSLAVTRAIGDAYLKNAAFSFSPYKEGVPYITSEPEVTSLELTSKDRFLILATDGVWEQVSNEQAVRCVSAALSLTPVASSASPTASGSPTSSPIRSRRGKAMTTSGALVDYVLARSAQGHGMTVSTLKALPRGPLRRVLHDDVCATVVHFTPPVAPA